MVKRPDPGAVKTRLVGDRYSPRAAAMIAHAMAACACDRLRRAFDGRLALAVSPDGAGSFGLQAPMVLNQGDGVLGDRLKRAWRGVRASVGPGPVAFFGADSPDVPPDELRRLRSALESPDGPDAVIGPVADGGYWTLGAREYIPTLLDEIEWGGPRVCEQTAARAERSGVRLMSLSMWYDVDKPEDLVSIRYRLEAAEITDDALMQLREELRRIDTERG